MDLTGTECVYVYMETPDSGKTPVTGSPDRGIREIAEEVGLSTFSAHSIVTEDLAMKSVGEIRAEAADGGAKATSC